MIQRRQAELARAKGGSSDASKEPGTSTPETSAPGLSTPTGPTTIPPGNRFDALADARQRGLSSSGQVVDHYVSLLLAHSPSPADRAVLLAILDHDPKGAESPFSLDAPNAARRLVGVLRLIVNMPEFQLN